MLTHVTIPRECCSLLIESNGPDKKKEPNAMKMSECKKMLPNLTIVSILLIRFNIKFYEIFA